MVELVTIGMVTGSSVASLVSTNLELVMNNISVDKEESIAGDDSGRSEVTEETRPSLVEGSSLVRGSREKEVVGNFSVSVPVVLGTCWVVDVTETRSLGVVVMLTKSRV